MKDDVIYLVVGVYYTPNLVNEVWIIISFIKWTYSKLCLWYISFIVFSLYTKVRSLLLRKSFEGYKTNITNNFRNIFSDVNFRVQDIQYQHLFSTHTIAALIFYYYWWPELKTTTPQHIYYQLKTSVHVRVINYKLRTLENW